MRKSGKSSQKRHLGIAAILMLSSGCSSGDRAGNNSSSDQGAAAAVGVSSEAIWQITSDTDPMTDVSRTFGSANFVGQHYNVEVTVACGGTGKLAYQIRSFDQAGTPAPIKRFKNIFGKLRPALRVRLDNAQPYLVADESGRFSNQVLLTALEAQKIARATSVVIQVPFLEGDLETYSFSQRDVGLQGLLQPCLAAGGATARTDETSVDGEAPPQNGAHGCWTPPSGQRVKDADQVITADEIAEIEAANGRPFQVGDTIWGKAEDRCPS